MRGRVFVRPTLTVRATAGGDELRALAELDDKPWAAQDGEPWMAVFRVDADIEAAFEVELAVAPDIAVTLKAPGNNTAGAGDRLEAADTARSRMATRRRPSGRLRTRDGEPDDPGVTAATRELQRERELRASSDQQLDQERSTTRRLQTELGQARAQLELAHTAQAGAAAAAAELDSVRRALREAQRRHEALTRERDVAVQAQAATQTELHERTGSLESAREALAQARAESSRLRAQLDRAGEASPGALTRDATRSSPAGAGALSEASPGRSRSRAERGGTPAPSDALAGDREGGRRSERGSRAASAGGGRVDRSAPPPAPVAAAAAARAARPVNPSLRHRTHWLGRLLALIVLLAVIAAIYLLIHSTITH